MNQNKKKESKSTRSDNTVTELECPVVRWFYQEPKKTDWIAFNGRESLMLEVKYRKTHGIALDEITKNRFNRLQSEEKPILVLDGQYKANISELRIDQIYWKNDSKEIRRGTWFTSDYQPLEMSLSDQIEKNHLECFKGHRIPEESTVLTDMDICERIVITEHSVDVRWKSVIHIHLHSTEKVVFFEGKPQRLHRGYFARATLNDKSPKISHLVLVVHGIGQKGNENGIVKNAKQVSEGVLTAMKNSYKEEKVYPMFLPIEWRSSLVLDKDFIHDITLPIMKNLKIAVTDLIMDIFYYKSPLYKTEIIHYVIAKLNQTYKLFKFHNPDFNGPVHIMAHSLGSVICYDILSEYAMEEQTKEGIERGSLKEERLGFKVKYFFAVGSPLGLFLTLDGATWKNLLSKSLNVERIFNIFHEYDPIAYRLEPFFNAEYKNICPVTLFSNTTGSYEHFPLEVDETYMKTLKELEKYKEIKEVKALTDRICDSKLMMAQKILEGGETVPNRIDFQIKISQNIPDYLRLYKTHISYWTNAKLALFLANLMVHETKSST